MYERPGYNASGLPDPTAERAIARVGRGEAPWPTKAEVRRMHGSDLSQLAVRLGLPQNWKCKSNRDIQQMVIGKLDEIAELKRLRQKEETKVQEPRAQVPDYTQALMAIVAGLNTMAAKLDDLTLAVMELKGEAKPQPAPEPPEVTEEQLASYVSKLDPLYLVGKRSEGAYEEFSKWCAGEGVKPCTRRRFVLSVSSTHPLHVDRKGAFAAGKPPKQGGE